VLAREAKQKRACEEKNKHGDEKAQSRRRHFLLAAMLLVVSEAPGATPSSASGSLGSLLVACVTAF
jgi:hypothetical protein